MTFLLPRSEPILLPYLIGEWPSFLVVLIECAACRLGNMSKASLTKIDEQCGRGSRQDKSTGAVVRLSGCLHIQDLPPLALYVSPQRAQVVQSLHEIRLHAPFGSVVRKIPESRRQQRRRISRTMPSCRGSPPRNGRFQVTSNVEATFSGLLRSATAMRHPSKPLGVEWARSSKKHEGNKVIRRGLESRA
jgi:hypothetical protein